MIPPTQTSSRAYGRTCERVSTLNCGQHQHQKVVQQIGKKITSNSYLPEQQHKRRFVFCAASSSTEPTTTPKRKPNAESVEHRRKLDHNRQKIDENLIMDVFGRSKPFWDGLGTPKTRSWSDLEPPGTRQERPGTVQKRSRASPKPPPDRSESTSGRDRSVERCRTRLRNDFSSFLCRRAQAPMCVSHQF